jgi:hypothetical protein
MEKLYEYKLKSIRGCSPSDTLFLTKKVHFNPQTLFSFDIVYVPYRKPVSRLIIVEFSFHKSVTRLSNCLFSLSYINLPLQYCPFPFHRSVYHLNFVSFFYQRSVVLLNIVSFPITSMSSV